MSAEAGLRLVVAVLAALLGVLAWWAMHVRHDRDRLAYAAHDRLTAGKQAELRLREREEQFRLIVESARDFAILTTDIEGYITSWNVGAEKLLGFEESEIVGEHGAILFTPEDVAKGAVERELETALRTGRAKNERWHVRKDGSRFWGSGLAMMLKFEGESTARGVVKIMRDRTEGRMAELALRESEERFRMLSEATPMIVSLADAEGRITYVSPGWSEFSGRPAEHFMAGHWKDVIHEDDRGRVLPEWERAFAEGRDYEYEFRARSLDGSMRWLLARGRPVLNEDGKVEHWVNCAVDITERKQAEAALREADRRKDEFLATLAHELRNPLAPLRNSLHILRLPEVDDGTQRRVVDMMDRQVNHLIRLVDDLMEASRITRGSINLYTELVDLGSIVLSAIETATPLIESSNHILSVELPTNRIMLEADPVRIAQVIANLLNNAAKYTEQGGRIWISAHREGDGVALSVRDNGTGIPSEMLPHVFDLFTQVDRTLGRAQGGLGIGLALVKRLVELHQGTVEVRSDGPGKGTEFTVRLPVARRDVKTEPEPVNHRLQGRFLEGRRLVVIDDNRDAADSLEILLRFMGADVKTSYDGISGLALVHSHQPSTVFLDLGMPGMDGYAVAAQIRKDPALQHVRLVALTGWGQEEDRQRARNAGFDHHITKPPELEAIEDLLTTLPA